MAKEHSMDPLGDGVSSVELVRASGSDLDVVNAARVSYGARKEALEERDEKLIGYLIKNRHTSPFEHTQLVYRIKAPIYITRQWMRHRVGVSYNEISGRYAELPLAYYIPKKWRTQDPNNKQGSIVAKLEEDKRLRKHYEMLTETATKTYKELLENGVCKELARGILPLCTYTEFIFTCNLVSLFHFAHLRADSHAQWEIQKYAECLVELAKPAFSISIQHWQKVKNAPKSQVF